MSERHQEGLAHLLYGINQGGGFVALTGEVGTGKTTLCHCLLQQLPDNIDIALVLNPKLNTLELLATVCDELQISYDEDKQTLKALIDKLNVHLLEAHAKGKKTVLIIDEAQNLDFDVLEQIRLLTNLETSKTKLLQIILIGQPELKLILEKPELRQLNQRITARYHLTPLTYLETQKYIKHRLNICGGNTEIFKPTAIKKIYKLSNGIPRLINILCDRALLGAYVTDCHFVSGKIVKQAAKEVFNTPSIFDIAFFKIGLISFFLLSLFVVTVYYISPIQPQKSNIIISGSFDKANKKKPPVVNPPKIIQKAPKKPINFYLTLHQQQKSFDHNLASLAELWGKKIFLGAGCKEIQMAGLQCLFDKSSWKELIALNRPVIMEFDRTESEKTYALLIGIKNGNPIFKFNSDDTIPIDQVLSLWNGYYVMLWQPPLQNINEVFPQQYSKAVMWIKKKLSIDKKLFTLSNNSSFYDQNLKTEVLKFQRQHLLTEDAIVGPRTFIHLSNNDPQNNSPKLKRDH